MPAPTLTPPPPRTAPDARTEPPLRDGMRLSRAEFHQRYEQMPGVRAELLEGTVHMPSPMKVRHASNWDLSYAWVRRYRTATPGTASLFGVTTILSDEDEPEPDITLWVPGRRADVNDDGYLEGSPEFLCEVADSTERTDRVLKRRIYERRGVEEYLLVLVRRGAVVWLVRNEDGGYVELPPGDDGLLRSRVFPGLWLDPAALLGEDEAAVFAALDRGVGTDEHAAFAASLVPGGHR